MAATCRRDRIWDSASVARSQDGRDKNADARDAGETQDRERQRRARKDVQIQVLVRHEPRRCTQRAAPVNSHAG